MPVLLAVAVAIGILAGVFALQNTDPVTVSFLVWKAEASLALVLLATFGLGAAMGIMACIPSLVRARLSGRTPPPETKSAPEPSHTAEAPDSPAAAAPPETPPPPAKPES
jgi:putative membrane protein